MATLKELMGDKTRGDGRKFSILEWENSSWFEPIYRAHNRWYGLMYDVRPNSFYDFEDCWEEWTPPKQTKKVKLYRPIYESPTPGKYVLGDEAAVSKEYLIHPAKLSGWHEIEVEVDG
ncbi:hypothetical protein EBS40_05645 [bacterium]|nr:hypothetical protein [bacterium]